MDSSHQDSLKTLIIHRQEPAVKHQEKVQTFCEVTLHYFGSKLRLDSFGYDGSDEIMVEQQHCGGNTLPIFSKNGKAPTVSRKLLLILLLTSGELPC
jgi:hypothetical protein